MQGQENTGLPRSSRPCCKSPPPWSLNPARRQQLRLALTIWKNVVCTCLNAARSLNNLPEQAQQANVAAFACARGYEVIASFTEVETGTNKRHRPELVRALKQARRKGAELLIAKLDRLARNVYFISGLMESKVRFTAVDLPEVDSLTVHILAAVAEQEARMISTRTRDALQAARARGVKPGTPQNLTTPEARQRGAQAGWQRAIEAYKPVSGYIQLLRP